jgi:hypothetical protein
MIRVTVTGVGAVTVDAVTVAAGAWAEATAATTDRNSITARAVSVLAHSQGKALCQRHWQCGRQWE